MTKKPSYIDARSAADWKKSEHHGAGTWLAERGTSLVLAPLTLWALYAAYTIANTGFDGAAAFLRVPLNAGLAGLTMLLTVWHMYLGLRVIVEDYVSREEGRGVYLFLIFLLSAAILIATGGALWFVHQGA